jgi:hypothetical protein
MKITITPFIIAVLSGFLLAEILLAWMEAK